jgi:Planctomycete cytochrome C.
LFLTIVEFIGRLHPALVHLPIGILLTALFLQWLSRYPKYRISVEAIKIILLGGMLCSILTCITGYILSTSGEYENSLVRWHMWMGIAVFLGSAILFYKVMKERFDVFHRIASVSLLGLIIITGHLGGSLTHGSDYFSSALNNSDTIAFKKKIIPDIQEAKAYEDVIQPIFQVKCYNCHNSRKQKGGLRMDDSLLLLKGGKDGKIIIPGKATQSEMIKRLLLPLETDHHMPPREKPQLTNKQIALIQWWVDQGADFNKPVKELQQPSNIRSALLTLQQNHEEIPLPAAIPNENVEAGNENTIKQLNDKGIIVIPVARGSNYLLANFVTASVAKDKDVQALTALKKQLVWLKMGNTQITDKALSIISDCHHITELDLTNTKITDEGLKALQSLNDLQTLNLVGTKISAKGLAALKDLKKLQSLYLFNTSIKNEDLSNLHKLFPKTTLDIGGYNVPFLNTDTIIVKQKKVTP